MTIQKIETYTADRTCNRSGSSRIGNTEYSQDWECNFQGPVLVAVWEDDEDGERWEAWECPHCYGEHDDELAPALLVEEPEERDSWVDTKDHWER